MRSKTQTEIVLKSPLLETAFLPTSARSAQLTIIRPLVIGNAQGAQLVQCLIKENNEQLVAIAKIYDPLYYSVAGEGIFADSPSDPAFKADSDYSREANSYEILRDHGVAGSFAPAYHGSWTFKLPTIFEGTKHERNIRLILIEHLNGSSLKDLFMTNDPAKPDTRDAYHLNEDYRLGVMVKVLHGLTKQLQIGVSHEDVAPRNIVVIPSPHEIAPSSYDVRDVRVVLIDYNVAFIKQKGRFWESGTQLPALPENPAQVWWDKQFIGMSGWLPRWWYEGKTKRRKWLLMQFAGEREDDYGPITETLDPDYEPTYSSHDSEEESDEALGNPPQK